MYSPVGLSSVKHIARKVEINETSFLFLSGKEITYDANATDGTIIYMFVGPILK